MKTIAREGVLSLVWDEARMEYTVLGLTLPVASEHALQCADMLRRIADAIERAERERPSLAT